MSIKARIEYLKEECDFHFTMFNNFLNDVDNKINYLTPDKIKTYKYIFERNTNLLPIYFNEAYEEMFSTHDSASYEHDYLNDFRKFIDIDLNNKIKNFYEENKHRLK